MDVGRLRDRRLAEPGGDRWSGSTCIHTDPAARLGAAGNLRDEQEPAATEPLKSMDRPTLLLASDLCLLLEFLVPPSRCSEDAVRERGRPRLRRCSEY